jgi:hypothetical protein
MVLILGIALMALALVAFVFSLPRRGKTARFVGTHWEGYAVVAMLCTFGVGLMFVLSGAADLVD